MSSVPGTEQVLNTTFVNEWIHKWVLYGLARRGAKEAQIKNVALPWAPTGCSVHRPQWWTHQSGPSSCPAHRVCFRAHRGYSVLTNGVPAVDTTHPLAFSSLRYLKKLWTAFFSIRFFEKKTKTKKKPPFYFILAYSQLTMLWRLQVDSKGTLHTHVSELPQAPLPARLPHNIRWQQLPFTIHFKSFFWKPQSSPEGRLGWA